MENPKKLPIGIDLGTSTSVIAIFQDDKPFPIPNYTDRAKSPITPSIVAMDNRGRLIVGERARNYGGVREVKRLMENPEPVFLNDKEFRPEQISAAILKELKKNATAIYGEFTDVVLSVPAIFTDVGKHNTIQAAKLAGLNVVHLISEPTAAALAYGIRDLEADEKVLVFDFGGGTLDISIVEMMDGILDVTGTYGDRFLGGKDYDEALMDLILNKFKADLGQDFEPTPTALSGLKDEAELCKIALSEQEDYTVDIFNFVTIDGIPQDLTVEITRAEFEQATASILTKAQACLEKALQLTKTAPASIDRVLLVGGSTYIPSVRKMVASLFNCPLATDIPPDLAVAMGTAIRAESLLDEDHPLILVDKIPYGMGVDILNWNGQDFQVIYDPLSAPNTTVPYSVTKEYRLVHEEQEELELKVYQTLNPHTHSLAETNFTGLSALITDIPHSTTGIPHPITVNFTISSNQTINLEAFVEDTGQSVAITFNSTDIRLEDPEELEKLKKELDELF